ncbi:LysR family transcriptional regulator [Terrarubrum flagellatum]|uniref:LysR family transcriptional regulator n=1 Tax=Terrirubrum flagellatum TaxID=2895980 RepID=UPI0031453D7F
MQAKQLEAFRLVMETGSVSRAAARLNVTQPTVSRLLSDLERSTGLTLFDRKQGSIRPRQEAMLFRDEVEKVFLGGNYLERVAAALRDNSGVRLRVGIFPAFSEAVMPPLVAAFRAEFPKVNLALSITSSLALIEQVAAGAVDLAIVAGAVSHASVESVATFSIPCVCALPANDPLAKHNIVDLRSLESESIIWMDSRSEITSGVRRATQAPGMPTVTGLEVNLAQAACKLVALGLGRAIIDPITASGLSDRRLVLRRIRPTIEFRFSIIRSVVLRLSAAGEAFIERLTSRCDSFSRAAEQSKSKHRRATSHRK